MELLDVVLDPWRSDVARRALLEVALLAVVCGPIGFWVLTERLGYGAESLAHALLPGPVIAGLVGLPLLLGAVAGTVAAAALIALGSREPRVGSDAATAVVVTGMLGLGALLALAPDTPQRLEELLFGDPLAVGDGDLVAAGALAVAGLLTLAALHRPLAAASFDREAAATLGLRPDALSLALLLLIAAAVAVALQGLGNLLVLAVLVGPPVAVRRLADAPGKAMAAAAAVGVVASVAGIYASFHLDVAAGAAVALALCAAAGAGSALPVRRQRAATGRAG